jgi:hypothetical protein
MVDLFIRDGEDIKKILKHLGLWVVKSRPAPKWKAPPLGVQTDDSDYQNSTPDSFYADPDYPMDSSGMQGAGYVKGCQSCVERQ